MKRPWAEQAVPTDGGEYIQLGTGQDARFEHTPAEKARRAEADKATKASKKAAVSPPAKE